MTSVRKKGIDHGEEHGEIQNLGSPILSKIQQAFLYIRTLSSDTAHEEFTSYCFIEGNNTRRQYALPNRAQHPRFEYVAGTQCGAIHIAWDKDEARLVLFVKVSLYHNHFPRSRFDSAAASAAQAAATCCNHLLTCLPCL